MSIFSSLLALFILLFLREFIVFLVEPWICSCWEQRSRGGWVGGKVDGMDCGGVDGSGDGWMGWWMDCEADREVDCEVDGMVVDADGCGVLWTLPFILLLGGERLVSLFGADEQRRMGALPLFCFFCFSCPFLPY
jgi:hypothetical protein